MHRQRSCSGGKIAIVLDQHPVDVIPFEPASRLKFAVMRRNLIAPMTAELRNDLIGASWFDEIGDRTALDGFDYGGDARVTAVHARVMLSFLTMIATSVRTGPAN